MLVLSLMNVYILFRLSVYGHVCLCTYICTKKKHAGQKLYLFECTKRWNGLTLCMLNAMTQLVPVDQVRYCTGGRGGKVYFFRMGRGSISSSSCIAAFLSILRLKRQRVLTIVAYDFWFSFIASLFTENSSESPALVRYMQKEALTVN